MNRRVVVLAFCAILGAGFLPGALHAANEGEAEAPKAEAPKGAAAWPDGLRYKVAAGDTLWSLSAKYLGSPWKWVELWERNRFLTNPHYIYPGTEVVIFPSPPRDYQIAGAAPRPVPVASAQNPEPVPAPEPEPPAAPAPAVIKKAVRPAAPAGPRMLDIKPSDFVRGGEFMRSLPKAIAKIRGGEVHRQGFAEGDKVYLTMKKPLPDGQLLGVYRVRGPITIPSARPFAGYVKYLIGVIQVTGTEDGVTTGKVRFSFEDIVSADLITDEIPAYSPVAIKPGADDMKAVVITGRRENREMATGDFIYLDKGEKAGVAVGNVFRIFNEDSGKLDEVTQEVAPRIEVARAVVVRISSTFATAYVVEGRQSFPAGVAAVRGLTR
jgi:LysM repeat protein